MNDQDPTLPSHPAMETETSAGRLFDGAGPKPGDAIGKFCLLEKIGEGGRGEVWLAEQREPIRRWVALKIVKPGLDTRQVVARFESERQVLALLDPPNIAEVLDAGVTTRGRPQGGGGQPGGVCDP